MRTNSLTIPRVLRTPKTCDVEAGRCLVLL